MMMSCSAHLVVGDSAEKDDAESEKRQNWISAPRRKLPKARFDRNLTFMTIVRFSKAFHIRIDLCHKFYLTTTLC